MYAPGHITHTPHPGDLVALGSATALAGPVLVTGVTPWPFVGPEPGEVLAGLG